MPMAEAPEENRVAGHSGDRMVDGRLICLSEGGALVFIVLAASLLHFLYELTGFQPWTAIFASVNESTFEHLKLFYWPALAYALVQHAFLRDRANNFWWAKAAAMVTAPLVLMATFYVYLGISLPIYGRGFLWADIGSGILGVLGGSVVAYRIMTAPELGRAFSRAGLAVTTALGVMFIAFTYYPPKVFIFENFAHYRYGGEFGILKDYAPYFVFK